MEELLELNPLTKPMFGCTAIYIEDKIVLILREKKDKTKNDDGVWMATTHEHHESLHKEFPNMRSIEIFGPGPKASGWQILPVDARDFEDSVFKVCRLILKGDPRIGKIPKTKIRKSKKIAKKSKKNKSKNTAKNY